MTIQWEIEPSDHCGSFSIIEIIRVTVSPAVDPEITLPELPLSLTCAEAATFAPDAEFNNGGIGICEISGAITPTVDADIMGNSGTLTLTWALLLCNGFERLESVVINVVPNEEILIIRDTLCSNETDAVDLTQFESQITDSTGIFEYSRQEVLNSSDLFISEYVEGSGDNKCIELYNNCLLYTSPSPRDQRGSRMPSSA